MTTSAAYENPSQVITLNAFPSFSMAEIWTPVWTRLPPIVIPSRRQGSRWPGGSFQDSGLSRMPVSQSDHEMSEFENDEAPTDKDKGASFSTLHSGTGYSGPHWATASPICFRKLGNLPNLV